MNCLGHDRLPRPVPGRLPPEPPPPLAIGSVRALTDHSLLGRLNRPFQSYYDDVLLPRLVRGGYDIVGINITYQWQLPFALWLAQLIRRALPDAFLVAGGTEVSDVWKFAADREWCSRSSTTSTRSSSARARPRTSSILDAIGAGTLPAAHPNVRLHPQYGAVRALPMLHYEKLATDPDAGLQPAAVGPATSARNGSSTTRRAAAATGTSARSAITASTPTARRARGGRTRVDMMIRDVTELSTFAKFIYFSVDVLAPARSSASPSGRRPWPRLPLGRRDPAGEVLVAGALRAAKRSGCTAISVGFESANQRILDLIDKGTKPAQVQQTITAMTNAGIGVQMMGFTGFPTETREEALDSIDFLSTTLDQWTFGGLGDFVLTPGAIVAKQPERFGMSNVRRRERRHVGMLLLRRADHRGRAAR